MTTHAAVPAAAVLHAAGGNEIGVGHLARTAALAHAIRIMSPATKVKLLWEASATLAAHFHTEGAEVILVESRRHALETRARLGRTTSLTLLITDLVELDPDYYRSARDEGFHLLAHINDSGKGRSYADIIVDEDPIPSSIIPEFTGLLLAGIECRIIGEHIVRRRPSKPWSKKTVTRVLLTLGGADPGGLSAKVLDAFSRGYPRPEFQIQVLAGPTFSPSSLDQLQEKTQSSSRLVLLNAVSDIAPLMLENDLIVTLGGISSYEAMCLGRPVACIRYKYMAPYVQRLAKMGLVADLGTDAETLANLVELVVDSPRLIAIAAKGYRVVDGRGAHRIAEQLLYYRGASHQKC